MARHMSRRSTAIWSVAVAVLALLAVLVSRGMTARRATDLSAELTLADCVSYRLTPEDAESPSVPANFSVFGFRSSGDFGQTITAVTTADLPQLFTLEVTKPDGTALTLHFHSADHSLGENLQAACVFYNAHQLLVTVDGYARQIQTPVAFANLLDRLIADHPDEIGLTI